MIEKSPKISVIVPCYNQAQYLDECLQSVLDQTYQNWECIIINDDSPDNTEDIAFQWTQKDSRFKYIKKENGGPSSTRNVGIENATGIYILPLDADDKISLDYVSKAIKIFEENPETTLVYCKAWLFGTEDGLWNLPEYDYYNLLFVNHIFCSAVFKKNDWERVEGYDEMLKTGSEDWDFWLRLLDENSIVIKLPIVGFFYRKKLTSMQVEFVADRENFARTHNYIVKKQINAFEKYYNKSITCILTEYRELKKTDYAFRNDYIYLARQIKFSFLLKSLLYKMKQRLKRR
jgi:glycosyltransferase involved in cell wall biosynthesis